MKKTISGSLRNLVFHVSCFLALNAPHRTEPLNFSNPNGSPRKPLVMLKKTYYSVVRKLSRKLLWLGELRMILTAAVGYREQKTYRNSATFSTIEKPRLESKSNRSPIWINETEASQLGTTYFFFWQKSQSTIPVLPIILVGLERGKTYDRCTKVPLDRKPGWSQTAKVPPRLKLELIFWHSHSYFCRFAVTDLNPLWWSESVEAPVMKTNFPAILSFSFRRRSRQQYQSRFFSPHLPNIATFIPLGEKWYPRFSSRGIYRLYTRMNTRC